MDPLVMLGATSAISSITGSLSSAFGSYSKNRSAEQISQYNAKLSDYNAAVALQNARLIEQSAALELARGEKAKKTLISKQRAYYAKAGVKSVGSPFDVEVDTASEFELDLQIEYWNAQVAATAQVAQSRLDKATSNLHRAQAVMYGNMKIVQPILSISEGIQRAGYQVAALAATKNPNAAYQYGSNPAGVGSYGQTW